MTAAVIPILTIGVVALWCIFWAIRDLVGAVNYNSDAVNYNSDAVNYNSDAIDAASEEATRIRQ